MMTAPCTDHPANPSRRRRAGLTIRYSGTNVKNDLSLNPNFKIYLCRGVDEFEHNPVGPVPTQRFARPDFKPVSLEEAGMPAAAEASDANWDKRPTSEHNGGALGSEAPRLGSFGVALGPELYPLH